MTTPNQSDADVFGNIPDLASLVGLGAFKVGGGGSTNWGQGVTEDFVQSLIKGPAISLPTSISDVPAAIVKLGEYLATLPLEALQLFEGFIPGSVAEDFANVTTAVSTIVNGLLVDPLGTIVTVLNQIIEIFQGLVVTPVNEGVQSIKDWVNAQENNLKNLVANLFGGLAQQDGTNATSADVGNAAADTSTKADSAASIGELNSAVLSIRNNKSIMSGIDETEESNFLMTDLFSGGTDPTDIISATASSVPVAYWRAEQAAKKGFISWFGKGFDNITALYIDVYKANYDTSTWDLIHTSPNQIGPVDTTWKYLVYSIADEAERLDIQPSDVLGVAWRVVGTGTHSIAGKSAGSWLPDHPTVVPARPASTRTGSGALAFSSTTYSSDIPWFGIGIVTGDIAPPVLTPRKQTFAAAGSFTYTIPEQFRVKGSLIDIVQLGDGGGGNGAAGAPGGDCGDWKGTTLEYGVDIPDGTTTITGTNGPGGAGGSVSNINGSNGSGNTVVVPGYGTLTAAGGAASGAPGFFGQGVTPFTYQGVIYQGGGEATVPGQDGPSPGAGGGSWATFSGSAGKGGRAQTWFVARQP